MKRLTTILILAFALLSQNIFSANIVSKRDSLASLLESSDNSGKLDLYFQLAALYVEINQQKAINYYKEGLVIAQKIGNRNAEYDILLNIAKKYRELGEYTKSIDYLDKALIYSEDNNEKLTDVYNELGINHANVGNYSKSMDIFMNYLKIQEEMLNRDNMIIAYNNISNLYMVKNNHETALEYCFKAIALEKEIHDDYSLSMTLNNVALIYADKERFDDAWSYFEEAEAVVDGLDNEKAKMHVYSNIADLAYKQGKISQSKQYLDKIIEVAQNQDYVIVLRDTYKQYANLYEKSKDFEDAYFYFKKYELLKDSLLVADNEHSISELKVIYDTESKEKENVILRKDNSIQKLKNDKQQRLIYFFILLIGLIVILIVVIFDKFRSNKKNSKLLFDKNEKIKKINTELKNLNVDLENRVSKRTEELQSEINDKVVAEVALKNALKKAEDANMVKDSFLSNISHEIRTPLNAIVGLSSLLSEKLDAGRSKSLMRYTEGIIHSSNRLLVLLNNIIDFSMIESNEINLEKESCEVKACVENASQLHIFKANEKGLKFNIDIPGDIPFVTADCYNLTKVVSDIIDNAVKYTDQGEISITAENLEEDNLVIILIKDTGIGINQEYLPNIFDSFSQENGGYAKLYQGAGLSLPLAKRLVELMGGRIEISSMKNKGSMVRITLNVSAQEGEDIHNIQPDELYISNDILKESGLNILIVEDDEFNALVIDEMLSKIGNTKIAKEGDEAMLIIQEMSEKNAKYDVMILDINLPGKYDGIELMNQIRSKYKAYEKVPFIAQTAYAMSKDRERLLKSGFDDYISKPIDGDELLLIIKSKLV